MRAEEEDEKDVQEHDTATGGTRAAASVRLFLNDHKVKYNDAAATIIITRIYVPVVILRLCCPATATQIEIYYSSICLGPPMAMVGWPQQTIPCS